MLEALKRNQGKLFEQSSLRYPEVVLCYIRKQHSQCEPFVNKDDKKRSHIKDGDAVSGTVDCIWIEKICE